MKMDGLAGRILAAILDDNLIDAVLDDAPDNTTSSPTRSGIQNQGTTP